MTLTTNPVLEVTGATSRAPDGTMLLDDVSFAVERGWLVAVVGPTGAGKSSLAKALLGQLPLSSGSVRVSDLEPAGRGRRGRVAGVPQEDATHPQLSLRRTLDHAAALRVDGTPNQRRQSVDAVLTELGLTSRAGTRLADLSGGERKRANVAVELLGHPDLLVLDEPTAGLDPAFERSVFASLRSLADTGRTIIAITHSMRVLPVCDRVLFLAREGTVAFFGSPEEAEAYFDWDDPADAYAGLSTEPAAAWRTRFAAHQDRPGAVAETRVQQVPAGDQRPAAPPWSASVLTAPDAAPRGRSGHLRTLLRRAVHLASSDRRALGLSLAAGPVLGLLLWAVLPGSTLRPPAAPDGETLVSVPKAAMFAFFLAMTVTWLGAAGAAREVVKERHILRRELGVGVSLSTYVMGKALFLSALTAVQVVPLAALALVKQQAPGRGPALGSGVAEVMVIALLVGVTAVATGLLVSSWASSSEKAMTALPVVLIAQLALAGPWAEDRSAVVDLVRQLIPAKWAAAAVSATVVGDASAWWMAALCLAGLTVVQLGAAFALLHRGTPARDAEGRQGLDEIGARLAASRPPAIRFVPAALALVLALAAGAGALGRSGGATAPRFEVAAAPSAAAPAAAAPTPTSAAPTPPPTAPPTTARPAPTPPPTTAPRAAVPAAPRTTTAPTTPPTTRPPTPPTTVRPTTATTAPPPAVTAANSSAALAAWILDQIFRSMPRR